MIYLTLTGKGSALPRTCTFDDDVLILTRKRFVEGIVKAETKLFNSFPDVLITGNDINQMVLEGVYTPTSTTQRPLITQFNYKRTGRRFTMTGTVLPEPTGTTEWVIDQVAVDADEGGFVGGLPRLAKWRVRFQTA